MATSLYIGSDETFLHVCDICEEDDRQVEAVVLCPVCDRYLCCTCKTAHERNKSSRSCLFGIGENLRTSTKTLASKISCKVHGPDEEMKYFCLVHEVPCCKICKLIDHRRCERIESLTNIVSNGNTKEKVQGLIHKSERLAREVNYLKSTFENELSGHAEQQKSMIETLRERRLKVEIALDKWEAKSVKAVKNKFKKESRVLRENVSICSEIAPEVRANIAKMQQALKKSDAESFIVMKQIQKDNYNYNDTFKEMHKVSNTIEMYLEKDNVTEPIKAQLKDTVKIGVRHHKDMKTLPSFSTRPYKDRVALDAWEINLSLQSDVETPAVTGIEVMHDQDNMILFCDYSNQKLKLLNNRHSSWTERSCSSNPWGLCKTDVTSQVIVAKPEEKCLELFNIENGKIMKGKTIKTTTGLRYIDKYKNCFMTRSLSETDGWAFNVTSSNGKHIKNIKNPFPSESYKFTRYQTIYSETLYITSEKYGCSGISMAGHVVFKHNDELVKDYSGVTTDPEGNVYISGTASNNVVMVSSEGETIKVVLDGIEKPRFMKYDEPTNTLFVYLMGTPVVKMYHLM